MQTERIYPLAKILEENGEEHTQIFLRHSFDVHGGSTYQSSVNRSQLKDGCAILSLVIPAMLKIMFDNHAQIDWGKPFYPVIQE